MHALFARHKPHRLSKLAAALRQAFAPASAATLLRSDIVRGHADSAYQQRLHIHAMRNLPHWQQRWGHAFCTFTRRRLGTSWPWSHPVDASQLS